jgi:hypothetical protein
VIRKRVALEELGDSGDKSHGAAKGVIARQALHRHLPTAMAAPPSAAE